MRVLGIDPGLAIVGIGLCEGNIRNPKALDYATIETAPSLTLAERLCEIDHDLGEYIDEHTPELAVIEKLYFSVNEKTALDVAQARGVVMAAVARRGIPILEPTPPELKSCITGDGKADKKQMQEMVKILYNLKEIPKPDDAADALALAAFGVFNGKNVSVIV